MIGKWNWTRIGGYDPGPPQMRGETMSTDPGPQAPRPPDRYDVRVVLDGEEAEFLNGIRGLLTAQMGGAINITVSDTIRYALRTTWWALQPSDEGTNGD